MVQGVPGESSRHSRPCGSTTPCRDTMPGGWPGNKHPCAFDDSPAAPSTIDCSCLCIPSFRNGGLRIQRVHRESSSGRRTITSGRGPASRRCSSQLARTITARTPCTPAKWPRRCRPRPRAPPTTDPYCSGSTAMPATVRASHSTCEYATLPIPVSSLCGSWACSEQSWRRPWLR